LGFLDLTAKEMFAVEKRESMESENSERNLEREKSQRKRNAEGITRFIEILAGEAPVDLLHQTRYKHVFPTKTFHI
jgi:hypothetical protein